MTTCLYCDGNQAPTSPDRRVCGDCCEISQAERIGKRLQMWRDTIPAGEDWSGEGHMGPDPWVYDFWIECDFDGGQLAKVEPCLGDKVLSMDWQTLDGALCTRWDGFKQDEFADHPRMWRYELEFGSSDDAVGENVAMYWRCNHVGIKSTHWVPMEGGQSFQDGIAGMYVPYPQPDWAQSEYVEMVDPTPQQVRRFVETGEIPEPYDGQKVIKE